MSRSRKKTPIGGIGSAKNDKDLKDLSNGKMRTRDRRDLTLLKKGELEPEDLNLPTDPQELTDPWCGAKDGKLWYGFLPKKQGDDTDEEREWERRWKEKLMRK